MEQVMIEIVPTIPVCILTGHWWPLLILWIDNAFISPYICHDRTVRKGWWLAVGVWHVDHHHNPAKNFGFYTIIWDVIFGTYKHPDPAPGPA
jgi:sterol desaturase/sphingolipid hydroxylase (fatty acid hydroxylase superfamily)